MNTYDFSEEELVWYFCEVTLTELQIYDYEWWLHEPLYRRESSTRPAITKWDNKHAKRKNKKKTRKPQVQDQT